METVKRFIQSCFNVQEFSWVGHGLITLAAGTILGTLFAWPGIVWLSGDWYLWGYVLSFTFVAGYYCFYREPMDVKHHHAKGDYNKPQGPGEASSRGDGVGDRVGPASVAYGAYVGLGAAYHPVLSLSVGVLLALGTAILVWNTDRARDYRASEEMEKKNA